MMTYENFNKLITINCYVEMNAIKETITRLGHSSRQAKEFKDAKNVCHFQKKRASPRKDCIEKAPKSYTDEELHKYGLITKNYQKRIYRDFLQPLDITNLKIFNQNIPEYNAELAKSNWQRKRNNDTLQMFDRYLEEQALFSKMLDLLVRLTPKSLQGEDLDNSQVLERILKQQEGQELGSKYREFTPRYHFHELPKMPNGSKEDFKKYIYFLTHLKVLYKNSLSLRSGIIPDILLHTHKLTNSAYEHLRDLHTYNFLIKYFGFDKNQSSFARELLLVMNKGGYKPNIETINNLLRMCKTHSHIRSITSTYGIIIKYLNLSRALGLEINLTTWGRVYDLIDNIFLKEKFINRIISINLPMLRNLCLRILDDYAKTTSSTEDVIAFITDDLKLSDWRNDSKLRCKVILHKALNARPEDIPLLWSLYLSLEKDEFSAKHLFEGLARNQSLRTLKRELIALAMYASMSDSHLRNPDIFRELLRLLCENASEFDPIKIAFLLRGVLHDAQNILDLPSERLQYGSTLSPSEGYRIIRRLIGSKLLTFEACLAYMQEHSSNPVSLLLPLSASESSKWTLVKQRMAHLRVPSDIDPLMQIAALSPSSTVVPKSYLKKYLLAQSYKIEKTRKNHILNKLAVDPDTYVSELMRSRGIVQ